MRFRTTIKAHYGRVDLRRMVEDTKYEIGGYREYISYILPMLEKK